MRPLEKSSKVLGSREERASSHGIEGSFKMQSPELKIRKDELSMLQTNLYVSGSIASWIEFIVASSSCRKNL